MNNFITHHVTFTPRKFISWTLIAALICQPVSASASLAGSLPPTSSNNDINLIGSTLESGNNLSAQGKNIVLLASVDQVAVQYSGGVSGKTKGSFASGNSLDERVAVSRLSAQGSIDLRAGSDPDAIDFDNLPPTAAGNIYSQGAALKAGQDINLQGGQIVLDAATENHSSQSSYTNTGGVCGLICADHKPP